MKHDEMIAEMQRIAGRDTKWHKAAADRLGISVVTLRWSLKNTDKPVPAPIVNALRAHRAGRRGAGSGDAFAAVDWSTLGKWSIVIPASWNGNPDITDVGVMCHYNPRFILFAQAKNGEKAGRIRYQRISGETEPASEVITEGLRLLERELRNAVLTRQEIAAQEDARKRAKRKGKPVEGAREWLTMRPDERIAAARDYGETEIRSVREHLRLRHAAALEDMRRARAAGDIDAAMRAAEEVGRLGAEQHIIASAAIGMTIDAHDPAVRLLIKTTLAEIVRDDARKDYGARSDGWSGDDPEAERQAGAAAWQAMLDDVLRETRERAPEVRSIISAPRNLLQSDSPPAMRTDMIRFERTLNELVYEKSFYEIEQSGGAPEVVSKWRETISEKIRTVLGRAGR